MTRAVLDSLTETLRQQRAVLVKELIDTEADLQSLADDREPEIEERAQLDRAARLFDRLDWREKHEIEQIDQALQRIVEGNFGICMSCGEPIPDARLRAVPATEYCVACAEELEKAPRAEADEQEPEETHATQLAPDLSLLSDAELRRVIVEAIRADGRVETHELRLVCRHGVVILDGAVPSEFEHQVLRKLIMDVVGVRDVRDQLSVNELLWERSDRDKLELPPEEPSRLYEPPANEDVIESIEDGTDYSAPAEPTADEE